MTHREIQRAARRLLETQTSRKNPAVSAIARSAIDLVEENERLRARLRDIACRSCGENELEHGDGCSTRECLEGRHVWAAMREGSEPELLLICIDCGEGKHHEHAS